MLSMVLVSQLENVERIDRMTASGESRRVAMLREIGRRRDLEAYLLEVSIREFEAGKIPQEAIRRLARGQR